MPAALKFFAAAIAFCSDSSLGIACLSCDRFSSSLLASAARLAFLNSSYLIFSFSALCFCSKSLRILVLWMKLSTLTFLFSRLSSKLEADSSILKYSVPRFLASASSPSAVFYIECFSEFNLLRCTSTLFSIAIFSLFSASNFFFLYCSFTPSSLNVSSTSCIYFLVPLSLIVTSLRDFFFLANCSSSSFISSSSFFFSASEALSFWLRGFLLA